MTFDDLQTRVAALLELGGYTNTEQPTPVGTLVLRAYREFVLETECNWEGDTSLVSVIDQAEYTLPAPDWKHLTSVYYGTSTEPLRRISPMALRRMYPSWLVDTSAVPLYYWMAKPKVIRLYPKPSTAADAITIYGCRMPPDFTASTDEPMVIETYHEEIAKRAYWLEAERTARGEDRQALMDQIGQYMKRLQQLKADWGQGRLIGGSRQRGIPEADRIT